MKVFRVVLGLSLLAASLTVAPVAASIPDPPCDMTDTAHCLLPFPNDLFTRPDSKTDTGKRIDFQIAEMPRDVAGKPIDPTEWNRNDGFSPGSVVMTFVPGLDLRTTWGSSIDHIADIPRFEDADAPILIIDATTGERHPFWSELDTNAGTPASERLLLVRPAINFLEGHRYLVALRNMRNASGAIIPAGAEFQAIRDGSTVRLSSFERSQHIEGVIDEIAMAETQRGNSFDRDALFNAWDFTVASRRNLTERALHIRDTAFAGLGDVNLSDGIVAGRAPDFQVTKVTARTDGARQKVIEGVVTVPNFLVADARPPVEEYSVNPVREATGLSQLPGDSLPGQSVPGLRFLYGPNGLPKQNPLIPTMDIPFVCTVPKVSSGQNPADPLLYGHGLLGDRNESVGGSTDRNRERNFMPCAVNWMGMAEYDVANALITLVDPSNMPSMMDRAQQGFLNFLFLGRALAHPAGLASHAAFRDADGPLFTPSTLAYDGNSQGGIMGASLTALAVDHTRAVLGVPGMNYSTLLNRSVDWEGPLVPSGAGELPSYSSFLYTMFPDKREQQVVMNLLQMLWDRGEGNGYAQHMTSSPLPNTPAHQVMLHAAYGDFQVANVSAEVEARTIGARVMDTALMPGRHWETSPYWGLAPFDRTALGAIAPYNGSALVYWDSGNLAPPNGNVPPALDGGDPHEDPRRDPRAGDQKATFWRTGQIVDVMAGGAYLLCRPGQESNIPRVPSQFNFDWCV